VTQTLVAEGDGRWQEYAGGYRDWLAQRRAVTAPGDAATPAAGAPSPLSSPAPGEAPRVGDGKRRKMSFAETRELAALPTQIAALESEQRELTERMCRPDYFRDGPERMRVDRARAAEIEAQLSAHLLRWEYLEGLQAGLG